MHRLRGLTQKKDQSLWIGLFSGIGIWEDGFERRLLATVRWTVCRPVAARRRRIHLPMQSMSHNISNLIRGEISIKYIRATKTTILIVPGLPCQTRRTTSSWNPNNPPQAASAIRCRPFCIVRLPALHNNGGNATIRKIITRSNHYAQNFPGFFKNPPG